MNSVDLKTGPRGGKYYLNKNGNKIYIKEDKDSNTKYCGPCVGYPHKTYPVSTNKNCRGSLSQAWRVSRPCDLALCIHRNCPNIGAYSKTYKRCGITVTKQSEKKTSDNNFIQFNGYLISEKVKEYLEKKVIAISFSVFKERAKKTLYYPVNDFKNETDLKKYIINDILELASNRARDNNNTNKITINDVKSIVDNDYELKIILGQ